MLVACLFSQAIWASNCSLTTEQLKQAQKVKVDKVIDGDTIRLLNGKLVRFVGINTPEIDHKFGNSEPYAERARDYVQAKVTRFREQLVLVTGQEKMDRHGRLLAHVFSPRGQNIQADILLNGYGVWITVPPNLAFVDCYRSVENEARADHRGVWATQFKEPLNTKSLTKANLGFQWIQGKINKIAKGRKNWWLNFEDPRSVGKYSKVTLRVQKDDLHYFNKQSLQSLKNKVIRVKGWLSLRKSQFVMTLRHPASLELVE